MLSRAPTHRGHTMLSRAPTHRGHTMLSRAPTHRGHAMLSRAGLRDDALLAHALAQQRLAQAVVDLVGALQEDRWDQSF